MQVPMNFSMTQDTDGWYCIVSCNIISEVMERMYCCETFELAIRLKRSIGNHTLTGPCLAANHSCSNIASDLQETSLCDAKKKKTAWYMAPVNVCPFRTNRNHNLPQLCRIHLHSILIVRYIFVLWTRIWGREKRGLLDSGSCFSWKFPMTKCKYWCDHRCYHSHGGLES